MRSAGARLLSRAQAKGKARRDLNGEELFALIAALAWLGDQPSLGRHADHLFEIIASAIRR
ncbi:SbtR family transcriptional regulator [Corallococcus interemptor]|uniref:SbtR family transcriptional regulator n=1 Tax=Corallococcus interemptor TaxID=2316720 RepID=UPI0034CE13E3